MKDTDGRTNPIVLFSYHSSFKTVPRRGDRDARSHSKSIRSLFCDLGFQECSDVVRIWYEFGTNWRYVEEKKNYSTWRYGIIYLTMYLGGLNEGLIQTVILSDRKYHQTGSKWTFIKVFQVFQDSKFSTKILNKIAQEILHFR